MRHPYLEQAGFVTPIELEVRKLTFNRFEADEAEAVAKFVLKSLVDDLDEITDWLQDHVAEGGWGVAHTFPGDSIEYVLKILFDDPDQAFHFRMRWL